MMFRTLCRLTSFCSGFFAADIWTHAVFASSAVSGTIAVVAAWCWAWLVVREYCR